LSLTPAYVKKYAVKLDKILKTSVLITGQCICPVLFKLSLFFITFIIYKVHYFSAFILGGGGKRTTGCPFENFCLDCCLNNPEFSNLQFTKLRPKSVHFLCSSKENEPKETTPLKCRLGLNFNRQLGSTETSLNRFHYINLFYPKRVGLPVISICRAGVCI